MLNGDAAMKERSNWVTFTSGRALLIGVLLTLAACRPSDARSHEAAEQSARKVAPPKICGFRQVQECITATQDECVQVAQAEVELCIRDTMRSTPWDVDAIVAWFEAVNTCTKRRLIETLTRNGKVRRDCNASAQ